MQLNKKCVISPSIILTTVRTTWPGCFSTQSLRSIPTQSDSPSFKCLKNNHIYIFIAKNLKNFDRISTEIPQINSDFMKPKCMGGLDLVVPFTLFTLNRQNINQVCWNICAGVLGLLHLPRWCRQNSHVTCS